MKLISNGSTKESVTIFSHIKSWYFGIFSHHYLTIPSMELEIHPGKYYQGTHHNLGTFAKNNIKTGQYELCQTCFMQLLDEATTMLDVWYYYPLINCETLTKGLLNNITISTQSLIVTTFITASFLSLISIYMFIIAFLSILLLIVLNNFCFSYKVEYCLHLKEL